MSVLWSPVVEARPVPGPRTHRLSDPFARADRPLARRRREELANAADNLERVLRGKQRGKRASDSVKAVGDLLNSRLTRAEKAQTAAAAVEAWLQPATPEGVEYRAVAELEQDAHTPRHSILGEGNWKVRVKRLRPNTYNPFRLAHHTIANAFDNRLNARYLVAFTEDGGIPYAIGPGEGMSRLSRFVRGLRAMFPVRELLYNTLSTERGRMSLTIGAGAAFAAVTNWLGLPGFNFEGADALMTGLQTVGVVSVGGAILAAYQSRSAATRTALSETFAWVKNENQADPPRWPDSRSSYSFFQRRLRQLSPFTAAPAMSWFQKLARLQDLPLRPSSPKREIREAFEKIEEGLAAKSADLDQHLQRFRVAVDHLLGVGVRAREAAKALESIMNEDVPDGVSVVVEADPHQLAHHPRHLAGSHYRVRARRVGPAFSLRNPLPWFSNLLAARFDTVRNARYLVTGFGAPVGQPESTTWVSRLGRGLAWAMPYREMATEIIKTDRGQAALGATMVGLLNLIVKAGGSEAVSLSGADEVLTWVGAGGAIEAFIQGHFARVRIRDEAYQAAVAKISERAQAGHFPGLDHIYGDVEQKITELSLLARPPSAFELQEALILEANLPLKPKYEWPSIAPLAQ
jgi:hypothetical protein